MDPLPRRRGPIADLSAVERDGIDPYKEGLPDDVQQQLAMRYQAIFEVFVRYPRITRVIFWGTHDGGTLLNNFPVRGRTNHPMLWDRQLKPKPAFNSVLEVLEKGK